MVVTKVLTTTTDLHSQGINRKNTSITNSDPDQDLLRSMTIGAVETEIGVKNRKKSEVQGHEAEVLPCLKKESMDIITTTSKANVIQVMEQGTYRL
jgi:hypothetical protein